MSVKDIAKITEFLSKAIDFFSKRKKPPSEVEDEARSKIDGNTLDDDIDNINRELRHRP